MATGVYPGSFDPFHLGHLAVVEQAARQLDRLVVGVLTNPGKRARLFGAAERVALVEASTAHLPNVRCVAFDGLAVDLARREGADVLVRAAHKEHGTERSMAAMNVMLSDVQTVFVATDPGSRTISSTVVRELVARGNLRAAARLVPRPVADAILSGQRGTA